jgi:hypothetical protein
VVTKKAAGTPIFQTPEGAVRLQINDVELDADGGRVVLVADNSDASGGDALSEDQKVMQVSLIINYRKDEPMRIWPSLRPEIAAKRYTITVTEAAPLNK